MKYLVEHPGVLSLVRVIAVTLLLTVVLVASASHFDNTEISTICTMFVALAGGESFVALMRRQVSRGSDWEQELTRRLQEVTQDLARHQAEQNGR